MTAVLPPRPVTAAPAAPAVPAAVLFAPGPRRRGLPAAWPVFAAIALYPLWVVLGAAPLVFIGLAVPMAVLLYRQRPVAVPPAFSLWLLLLLWNVISMTMLRQTAPGTLAPGSAGGGGSPYFDSVLRIGQYVAVTVLLLYIGNLPRHAASQLGLARIFSALFVLTVVGGYLGTLLPHLRFFAPLHYVLPHFLLDSDFIARATEVTVAQVQSILPGESAQARASFPFEYTNTWGQNYTLLLPWFLLVWWHEGSQLRRAVAVVVVGASLYPVAASLNRGLWLALTAMVALMLVRWVRQGRVAVLVVTTTVLVLGLGALVVSPAGATIADRLANGHSDAGRANLNAAALDAALSSPVIGYGAGRLVIGSGESIAIGATPACPQCGNLATGSDGQLWLLLASQGFFGAAFYVLFFLLVAWRFRRDTSAYGLAGRCAVLLPLLYMGLYPVVGTPLALALGGLGVLWRNDRLRREERPAVQVPFTPGVLVPAGGARR